jgi:putative PIG3 family NAD(P)H quinone oxidoreductase
MERAGDASVLTERKRPDPQVSAGFIRVRVRTSALNRADILQRRGGYAAPAGVPADVPGLEYAGEVDQLGDGVSLWREGDRVMGIIGGGGHAEFVVVHEREAISVPASLSWEEAAAIPEVFLTAYDALFRLTSARPGERVLIHAVGSGVGTAAVQLACQAGLSTLGTSRSPEKLARARDLGLHHAIDTSSGGWLADVMRITEDEGVDLILDLVGGNYLADNVRALGSHGRLIVIGLTSGSSATLDLNAVLRKRLHIVGTVLRSRPIEEKIALAQEFAERALPMFEDARLRPVIDRVYSFADIRAAHEQMESNDSFGKIILRWS